MAKKRFGPEQVVTKLRQIEVLMGEGKSLQQAVREAGSSNTMKLRYGFNGASVFDKSKNAWVYLPMTTITRGRVDGYVNQVNDKFALAAGLHSVAVYDYSKHQWVERKPAPVDDSSGDLKANFQFSDTTVKVKTLNGPAITYTTARGWQ